MTRTYTSGQKTVKAGDHSRCNFVELTVPGWTAAPFTNGIITVNTTALDFTHDSKTYFGADGVLSVESIVETSELKRQGVQLTFNGLNTSLLNLFLTDQYDINKTTVKIFDTTMTVSGTNEYNIDFSVLVHEGLIDNVEYKTSSDSTTITVRTVSIFSDWFRPRLPFLDDQSQKERNSNDKSLSFLSNTVNQVVTWGNG